MAKRNPVRSTAAALLFCGTALTGMAPSGAGAAAADAPVVVATIKPLHALVAGVMAGVGEPRLLVQGAASPHDFALKPSDARVLDRASLVFWAGPGVESFMPRVIDTLARDAHTIALIDAPGVKTLAVREGGVWEPHEHDHDGHEGEDHGHDDHDHDAHADAHDDHDDHDHDDHDHDGHDHDGHDDHDGHEHGMIDGHAWLSPANARAMVTRIAAVLAEADPAHAETYRRNATAYEARLDALDAQLAQLLAPVKDRPYIVFHDAYQYFESAYGLAGAGSVTLNPEQPPGARRISELRARITEGGVVCVFAEPQFDPRLVKTLTEGTAARSAVLDPIGSDITAGADAYLALMERLATSLSGCLSSAG